MTHILFIPEARAGGFSERTPTLYRMLRTSYDVIGLPSQLDSFAYDTERAKWPRYLLYAVDKALLVLRGLAWARRYCVDVVFSETSHHALVGLVIARILGIRCIWDSHANVKLYSESVGKGWFFTTCSIALERFLGKRVDALITVTEREADAYFDMGIPRSTIHVIPTFIVLSEIDVQRLETTGREPGPRQVPVLLFFGSHKYLPNREALEFINDLLAPDLERRGIRCEIRIAGRDIPDRLYHPSIKILGFVPDIHSAIRQADVCIVPVWKGTGILTKILDIMAVGTPMVLSKFAAEMVPGIEDRVHAYIAPSRAAFPEFVVEAVRHPVAGAEMAKRSRQLVEKKYSWESNRATLEALVRESTPRPGKMV